MMKCQLIKCIIPYPYFYHILALLIINKSAKCLIFESKGFFEMKSVELGLEKVCNKSSFSFTFSD